VPPVICRIFNGPLLGLLLLPGLAQAQVQLPWCELRFDSGARRLLPLAATPESRTTGLSGRDEVGAGMLFAWAEEGERQLWMKATRVPLSAAFIDAGGVVVRLADMQPFSLQRHGAVGVRYILEVRQGEFNALRVRPGSRVRINCPGLPSPP
jgi:uncharacterized membrane protein (UPF0127 family)